MTTEASQTYFWKDNKPTAMLRDKERFRLLLLGCCIMAVGFQCVGFFTKGWIQVKGVEGDLNLGLWSVDMCAERQCHQKKHACQSLSYEKLASIVMASSNRDAVKEVSMVSICGNGLIFIMDGVYHKYSSVITDYYMTEMLKARALTTTAGLFAVFGLLTGAILFINPKMFYFNIQTRRLACCLTWLTSSILLLAAVICASEFHATVTTSVQYYNKLTKSSAFEVSFPWSILSSGFGVLFSAISSSLVAFLMCFTEKTTVYATAEEKTEEIKFQPSRTIFI